MPTNFQTQSDATTGLLSAASRRRIRPCVRCRDMSSNAYDVFKSHHEVMEALQQTYAGTDDAQRAVAVGRLQDDVSKACQMQQEEVKTTIAGLEQDRSRHVFNQPVHTPSVNLPAELCQQVQETQVAATPQEAPEAHLHRVHQLSAATQDTKENVDSLNRAAR